MRATLLLLNWVCKLRHRKQQVAREGAAGRLVTEAGDDTFHICVRIAEERRVAVLGQHKVLVGV